jgi:hypothetical protein
MGHSGRINAASHHLAPDPGLGPMPIPPAPIHPPLLTSYYTQRSSPSEVGSCRQLSHCPHQQLNFGAIPRAARISF